VSGFAPDIARRVGTAAVALPLLVLALFAAPAWVVVGLIGVASLLGLVELFAMLRARGVQPMAPAGVLGALVLFVTLADGWVAASPLPFVAVLVIAAALWRARRAEHADTVHGALGTLLAIVYVGGLGGTMAALRTLDPLPEGPWRVTLLLAVIMTADTGAYLAGSAFGRHRLAPRVSPAKSWEGLAGGIVGGIVAALVVRALGLPTLPAPHAAVLGAAAAAVGTAGDLFESLLKRWAGVKDSGTLFPGHGGMLDRLDSLLAAAPVLYYYFLYSR
jgi:phosphatidate cytidylyltransferase